MGKAKTKAEKLRIKRDRGRPRLEVASREANGRASRAIIPRPTPDAADKLTLEVRAKKLGLTVIDAKNQLAATFIGRLYMQHRAWEEKGAKESRRPLDSINERQHSAAVKYRELHNDYLKAVGAPGALYDGKTAGSGDDEALAKWAANIKEKHAEARKAIFAVQCENRGENLWAALDYCILRDEGHLHMIGGLRILCNALAHHWKIA